VSEIQNFTFDVEADQRSRESELQARTTSVPNETQRLQQMHNSDLDPDELNPLVAEKLSRDAEFAGLAGADPKLAKAQEQERQGEVRKQEKESKLHQLGAELDKWKSIAKRRKDDQMALEGRLRDLETRVNQNQPMADVRQVTGRNADEVLTAGEVWNLLLAQSGAFGQQFQQLQSAIAQNREAQQSRAVSDVDEAELTYMHPWLENLPVAQRERAMLDMIATRNQPPAPEPPPQPSPRQVAQGQARVREINYIEASNRGSLPEVQSQEPQKAAANQKLEQLQALLSKPGGSTAAGDLLASLGAGPDDAEGMYLNRRR
jgi:hypothetical protein